ncbi:MAG: ComEC/Rec2 family competence protein, partial [Culicoidibacterales bacterium]
ANENDNSLVTLVTSGNRKALLTGDSESGIEATLTGIGDVDVFKAGHHGSKTSNSTTLLNAITPEHIVLTVGSNNKYGHPAAEVMSRFETKGIPVYRNDEQGTITVRLTDDEVAIDKSPASYTPGS